MTPECTYKRETTYQAICYARRGNQIMALCDPLRVYSYVVMYACVALT